MSLFKIRTFWTSQPDQNLDETFDQNSLTITKLNTESDLLITGSHSNILRIFKPNPQPQDATLTSYSPSDLLMEKILNQPIIQLGYGRLVSGSSKIQLAVLQPRLLAVYTLITKQGAIEHGAQNILQVNYEHKLRRTSFCFVVGAFGGVQNRDFICIQSLDGLLTFFEQETFSFCVFLPDFLLPSPVVFVRKSDSFIACNSSWFITSFKYKLLSEAGHESVEDEDVGKRVCWDWRYSLGEAVLDLEVVEEPNNKENFIVVLGERNLFCLNDGGKLKYMKRLEFSPICFTNHVLCERMMSLVVAETGNLLIYQNTSLKWAAQLPTTPICIKRAFFEKISGVLVLLTETGTLDCAYLGTDPSLFIAPPLSLQPLDFEKVGQELTSLYKTIRTSYTTDIKTTNASAERDLTITTTVHPQFAPNTFTSIGQMCSVSIEIIPQTQFEEVQISIFAPPPLMVDPSVEFYCNLSERAAIKCRVFFEEKGEVASLELKVVASFIGEMGVSKTATKRVMLPMELAVEGCASQKDGGCKVVLNINESPAALSQLFPEFVSEESSGNALGFRNITGEGKIVTVLLAKSSQRYRLQSDSFASLNLFIEQIVHRLNKFFSSNNNFKISFNSSLPTEPIQYVHQHFTCRQNYNALQHELTQLSAQFRLIQKRLISKFKVKNPTPLANLELLLDDTYNEIIKLAETIEKENANLTRVQQELSCALHVLNNLIGLMDCGNIAVLVQSCFSPDVYDLEGQNWEDVADASLCYVLRTVLAKSEKDKLRAAHTSFDEVKDAAKLEKHFLQVLERVGKVEGGFEKVDEEEEEDDKAEETLEERVPIGSRIGEASTRLLSARKGLLNRRQKLE